MVVVKCIRSNDINGPSKEACCCVSRDTGLETRTCLIQTLRSVDRGLWPCSIPDTQAAGGFIGGNFHHILFDNSLLKCEHPLSAFEMVTFRVPAFDNPHPIRRCDVATMPCGQHSIINGYSMCL